MADYTGKRAGNYTIVKKLGDGGFATVYLAQHTILEKKAAVKFLLEEWVNEADVVGRFFDEARTMERLKDHPNIISIIDIASQELCEKEGLPPYFIMEFIDGKSLEQAIRSDESFTLEWILDVVSHSLSALDHCHSLGVVHRDIKPSNILIKADGTVKLTDFGIAKAKLNTSKTGSGLTLGSTDYMSPEQALGKRDLDHRSDIYSLGVTLYELVTGKLPFISDNANSVALMHIQETPKPPMEMNEAVPQRLNDIILKAMEKKKEDRFQSCQEFLDALKKLNEPEAPVVAEVETVDLSKMKAENPEEDLLQRDTPEGKPRTTRIQQTLAAQPVRSGLFWLALVIGFTVVFLGVFKGITYLQECKVTLKTLPAGAAILLDGNQVGTAPLFLKLKPGVYRVEMTLDGHHPLPIRLGLTSSQVVTVEKALRKIDPQPLEDLRKGVRAYDAAAASPPKVRAAATIEAFRRLTRLLQENNPSPESHQEFVAFCIQRGLVPNAEAFYKAELIKQPQSSLFNTMLGRLAISRGDMKAALDLYTKAWYADPDNIDLLNSLGDYFLANKDKDRARQYYKNSLFLNPKQEEVLQKLQGL